MSRPIRLFLLLLICAGLGWGIGELRKRAAAPPPGGELTAQIKRLCDEARARETHAQRLAATLSAQSNRADTAEAALRGAEQANEELRDTLTQMMADHVRYRSLADQRSKKISEIETALADVNRGRTGLEDERRRLEARISQLEDESTRAAADRDRLRSAVVEAQTHAVALESRLAQAATQEGEARKRLAAASAERDAEAKARSAAQKDADTLRKERDAARAELAAAKTREAALNRDLAALREAKQALQSELAALRSAARPPPAP